MHRLALLLSLAACPKAADPAASATPLDAFVAEVLTLASTDDWNALLERCDAEQRRTQIDEMGMAVEQYVAEQFGLHTVGNSIDAAGDGLDAADLGRVGTFTVRGKRPNGAFVDVYGDVEVAGQGTLQFTFTVIATPTGYRLTGGVG